MTKQKVNIAIALSSVVGVAAAGGLAKAKRAKHAGIVALATVVVGSSAALYNNGTDDVKLGFHIGIPVATTVAILAMGKNAEGRAAISLALIAVLLIILMIYLFATDEKGYAIATLAGVCICIGGAAYLRDKSSKEFLKKF